MQKAVRFIRQCDSVMIGAGAGIAKDSGLPDFRGNQGFWNNYPPYKNKFNFYDCANPNFLLEHPHLFWGFYGSRLKMYREKIPHQGYHILKQLADKMRKNKPKNSLFVVTSNVDGHFLKADYREEDIYEIHGSIHHLQCNGCSTIRQNNFEPDVDYDQMTSINLPLCRKCGEIQRSNILMFGDWDWNSHRAERQEKRYAQFKRQNVDNKVLLIQIGCGTAIPTIRNQMQQFFYLNELSKLIRINPDEGQGQNSWLDSNRYVQLQMGALQALSFIQNQGAQL